MFISVSSQTTLRNIANFFVFTLADATDPGTILETIAPPKPYGNPLQISFTYNCISGKIYIITLWESAGSTPTGIVRNSFSQAVNGPGSIMVRMTEYLEVDITPGLTSGATNYTQADLAGWDYMLFRNNKIAIPDYTTSTAPDYHKETAGFTLVVDGDVFAAGENFEIVFEAQIIPADSGAPSAIFSSGEIITTDTTLTNTKKGKALLIQAAGTAIAINMPLLSTVADFDWFYLYSCGGNQINAVINAAGSDTFLYPAGKPKLILGQCEALKVFKAFGYWNVDNDLPGVRQVGELLYDYSPTNLNTAPCAGQVLNRADYPRLWAFVQGLAEGVTTDSDWTGTFITDPLGNVYYTKRGCFSTGNGTTTFRMPLLTDTYLKGVDGSARLAGSFNYQSLLQHGHKVWGDDSGASGGNVYSLSIANVAIAGAVRGNHYMTVNGSSHKLIEETGSALNEPNSQGSYILMRI